MNLSNFNDFIENFDFEGCVVLLAGKRKVRAGDEGYLIKLGQLLAEKTNKIRFRSGNASGADELFSKGISMVDSSRLEVVTPYDGHRKKANNAYTTYSLDTIDLSNEPEVVYQTRKNSKVAGLVDNYMSGLNPQLVAKAAYVLRDTVMVVGSSEIAPANFAIFYDDLQDPGQGGTGHTMTVCRNMDIKQINQNTWFDWVK